MEMASVGFGRRGRDGSSSSSTAVVEELRLAVRLIHCLQKERGSSCAFCAYKRNDGMGAALAKVTPRRSSSNSVAAESLSGHCTRTALILSSVESARVNSDAALAALLFFLRRNVDSKESFLPSLRTLRALVDDIGTAAASNRNNSSDRERDTPPQEKLPFHRCIVMFNSVISSVVQTHLVQVVKRQQHHLLCHADTQPTLLHPNPHSTPTHNPLLYSDGSAAAALATYDSSAEADAHTSHHRHAHILTSPPSPGPAVREKFNSPGDPLYHTFHHRPSNANNLHMMGMDVGGAMTLSSSPHPTDTWPPTITIGVPPLPSIQNMPRARSISTTGAETPFMNAMAITPSSDPLLTNYNIGTYPLLPRANSPSLPFDDGGIRPMGPSLRGMKQSSAAENLLSLLLSFVSLKESTGVERAVLSSFMAMGGQDEDTTSNTSSAAALSMLFNDLVLEEANQRTFIRKLNRQTRMALEPTPPLSFQHDESYKSLMALVAQSVRLSPQMEQLQDMIRKNFDLKGFQSAMSLEEFWGFITLYMDQLHALELLIIEELECCIVRSKLVFANNNGSNTTSSSFAAMSPRGGSKKNCRVSLDVSSIESPTSTDEIQLPVKQEDSSEKLLLSSRENTSDEDKVAEDEDECEAAIYDDEKNAGLDAMFLQQLFREVGWNESIPRSDALKRLRDLPSEQLKALLLAVLSNIEGSDAEVKRDVLSSSSCDNILDVDDKKKMISAPPLLPTMTMTSNVSSKEWEIDLYEIEFKKRIGRGIAGTTYLANWSGQAVAVKVAAITDMGLEGWNNEVQSLQKLHHPNIIRLLGSIYNASPQTYGLVLEYCESGDLSAALSRWTPLKFFWKVSGDIANGMNYLHNRKILHRDIKPGNVLLTGDVAGGNFTAKLSDLGVAIMHQGEENEEHTAETGTYRWMAPEVIRHESYSFMADVYSFAVVAWQLITREEPFSKYSQIEAAGYVSIAGERPPLPSDTPMVIANLIHRCWSENPYDRYSFHQISLELKQAQKTMSNMDKEWLGVAFGHPVYEIPKLTTSHHHIVATGGIGKETRINEERMAAGTLSKKLPIPKYNSIPKQVLMTPAKRRKHKKGTIGGWMNIFSKRTIQKYNSA